LYSHDGQFLAYSPTSMLRLAHSGELATVAILWDLQMAKFPPEVPTGALRRRVPGARRQGRTMDAEAAGGMDVFSAVTGKIRKAYIPSGYD
jgi:hypothetical protein